MQVVEDPEASPEAGDNTEGRLLKESERKGESPEELSEDETRNKSQSETGNNHETDSVHNYGNEGSYSDESESDAESDIEEPRLKYSRISSLPKSLFSKDALSTVLITEMLFVFATHSGVLHLTKPDFAPIRSFRAHRASILSLSTDGHYLASASMDGTVVIGSITDEKDITASDFHRPLNAVALDPNYKTSKIYVSGGMAGNVVYSERNWLGRRSDTNLHEGQDPIVSIHWIGNLIIWMSDQGITVYSALSRSTLLSIPRQENSPRADLYTPRICLPESNLICISWVNQVWTLRVSSKPKRTTTTALIQSAASIRSLPNDDTVEILSHLQLDCHISGIAPYDHDTIMILCFAMSSKERHPRPELKLIDREFGEELYADELSFKEYDRLGVNDYHLGFHVMSGRYFLLSARDSIVAVKRDLNDRLSWLQERDFFKEAWALAEKLLPPPDRFRIGLKHLDQLVEGDQWDDAGYFLAQLLSPLTGLGPQLIKEEWDKWGWIFVNAKHTESLASYLPLDPELGVDHALYDSVLLYSLENDRFKLKSLLEKWNIKLFNSDMIKNQLEDEISDDPAQSDFRRLVANLYLVTGDPSHAVNHLLYLSDPSVVDIIAQFHLLPFVEKYIGDILTVGIKDTLGSAPVDIIREETRAAIKLVVDGRHELIPSKVVQRLNEQSPRLDVMNFLYLEELNEQDPFAAEGFADLELRLFAEFDRPQLFNFLKKSNYNLSLAVQVCEQRDYIPELVYLLGKVGQNDRALKLIIERIGDPVQAIAFAKEQNDKDLWNDLLEYSMDKPLFIKELLIQSGSGAIDPLIIFQRIPSGMEISSLKEILVMLFIDKEISLSLIQAAFNIIESEARDLSHELRSFRLKGDPIDFEKVPNDLDLTKPVILMPTGDLKTENDLVGDDRIWRGTFRNFGDKIRHLYYILSQVEGQQ